MDGLTNHTKQKRIRFTTMTAAIESISIRDWAREEDHPSQQRVQIYSRWGVASLLLISAIMLIAGGNRFSPSSQATDSLVQSHIGRKRSSPYTATQFISFTINTMGGIAKHGECTGRDVAADGTCYLGSFGMAEDVERRALIVGGILEALKNDIDKKHPDIDHRDDVLKIFAMPEFFWRGPYGAYTPDQIEDVVTQVFAQLEKLISDEAFSHYLFVFGTVITVKPPDASGESLETEVKSSEYGNFCPVYKGGPAHEGHFLVTKKYISMEDFLNRDELPNPRNYNMTEYKHDDFSDNFNAILKEKKIKLISDNVLPVDGLLIGLEICLDHNRSALWDNLQEKYDSELMDLHIVASAGMSIERGPNPVIPGGVTYLSDGTASSAACMRSDHGHFDPETSCRVFGPKGLKHLPTGGSKEYSEFFVMSACVDVEKLDFLEGYYSNYQPQGCGYTLKTYGIHVMDTFDIYPPSIEIYPVVDLPKRH